MGQSAWQRKQSLRLKITQPSLTWILEAEILHVLTQRRSGKSFKGANDIKTELNDHCFKWRETSAQFILVFRSGEYEGLPEQFFFNRIESKINRSPVWEPWPIPGHLNHSEQRPSRASLLWESTTPGTVSRLNFANYFLSGEMHLLLSNCCWRPEGKTHSACRSQSRTKLGRLWEQGFWLKLRKRQKGMRLSEVKLILNPKYSLEGLMLKVKVLWLPYAKNWLIGKDPDAGKDWGQEEKRAAEDEMVGWHHWFNGHEFKQTPRDSEGEGRLACWSPWGRKESDTTEQLNNNNNNMLLRSINKLPADTKVR